MLIQTFIQTKLVVEDIAAGLSDKFQRILKKSQKISALAMAIKMTTLAIVLAILPATTSAYQPKAEYQTAITFNKSDPFILSLADNKTFIEIGPSRYDEEQAQIKNWVKINGRLRPLESVSHRDPAEFRPIYQAAAQQFGIPWQLIEAVHEVETGKSGSTAKRSYAGAQGPMQFMPGTWRGYAVDGNNDGNADITDVVDAIYTGAHYLARSGADEGRIDDALFNYNHSMAYVNKVKTIACEIGM